jgi:hypothetical protein
VSESEYIAERDSENSVPLTRADDLAQRVEGRTPEREGLPRTYRMRADAHYVEQLSSPVQPVVRQVAVAQLECRDLPPADVVEPLTKSIAAHGVLQPLLVRRQGGKYALIAGRKRLAAAIAAKLTTVPCLHYDVEGAAALALAEADNLRVDGGRAQADAYEAPSQALLQTLISDLATIRTSVSLLRSARGGLAQQVGTDLVDAQIYRVTWLANCLRGAFEDGRLVSVGAIIQKVIDEFSAHARLAGVRLESSVNAEASTRLLAEEATAAAVTGALFATLAYVEDVSNPKIELNVEAMPGRALMIDVIQRSVRVMPPTAEIGQRQLMRPESLIPSFALRLATTVAAARGGVAEIMPLAGQGSIIRLTFPAAQSSIA